MKISIIGAGNVGSTAALRIAEKAYADEVVLVDIIEDMPNGKALDLLQSSPIVLHDTKITGSNDFSKIKNSNIVLVTSGVPRKPGMSRVDLLNTNAEILKSVSLNIKEYAPDSIVIVVSNPVTAMTYVAKKITGFSKQRVFGMAGVLDTARFKTFIAMELNVSVEDITALVLGDHGDSMVPIVSRTLIGGIPITELLPKEKIDALIERTRKGGAEIVNLLKTGSAYYAPAASLEQMTEAIVKNRRRFLSTVAYLDGEYGFSDCYISVPALIGREGVLKVFETKLTDEEKEAFNKSTLEAKNALKDLAI